MNKRVLCALACGALACAQAPQPNGAGLERGTLPARWSTAGPSCMEMQEFQVHQYNPNFYILRQSGCTDYEKPFIYLMFGTDRAFLWDTGSRNARTREAVDRVMERWLKVRGRTEIQLVIAHSHRHSDHVAGDAQFKDRPNTTLVEANVGALRQFFGFKNWPDETVQFDLGSRVLDIVPIPGHSEDSHAIYDRRTGILLTGDSLYPGRLYVADFAEFRASIRRLAEFTRGRLISHVLGCHIEQTRTPYLEYPIGKLHQPDEHELALGAGHILELDRALSGMRGAKRVAFRDFTIYPLNSASLGEMKETRRKTEAEDVKLLWQQ